jgi:hypothetical protein
MFPALVHLRTVLDGVHPGLFNAILSALLLGAIWVWRKFWPASFAKLPTAVQAAPALAGGAVLGALSANINGAPIDAVLAALVQSAGGIISGLAAIGTHHALKESPLPYGNPKPVAAVGPTSMSGVA